MTHLVSKRICAALYCKNHNRNRLHEYAIQYISNDHSRTVESAHKPHHETWLPASNERPVFPCESCVRNDAVDPDAFGSTFVLELPAGEKLL